jgi:hypothetical protein
MADGMWLLQDVLPYDPETNLWKRGPGGSMYHSPPVASKDGGFVGALKRKAHGLSPLSSHTVAPAGGEAGAVCPVTTAPSSTSETATGVCWRWTPVQLS